MPTPISIPHNHAALEVLCSGYRTGSTSPRADAIIRIIALSAFTLSSSTWFIFSWNAFEKSHFNLPLALTPTSAVIYSISLSLLKFSYLSFEIGAFASVTRIIQKSLLINQTILGMSFTARILAYFSTSKNHEEKWQILASGVAILALVGIYMSGALACTKLPRWTQSVFVRSLTGCVAAYCDLLRIIFCKSQFHCQCAKPSSL